MDNNVPQHENEKKFALSPQNQCGDVSVVGSH